MNIIIDIHSFLCSLNDSLTPVSTTDATKVSGIVFINKYLTGISVAGLNTTLFTLPNGYRPSTRRDMMVPAVYNGNLSLYSFYVESNGNVITNIGGGTVTAVYFLNTPFPI